ncbi:MAG: glycosyltransferase family 4 protein [Lachnospiraceae bacterium]|nr:glycosyltransferase family 4 protein [Lachnospiraceae bacterium]
MKICMILPHFYPYVGGAEKLFYDLAVALVLRGHEVRVITQDTDTGKHGAVRLPVVSADGEGGTGKFIQACYFHWPEFFGHPLVKSENLEKHIRWADVVHTSTFTPSPPVSKLCKKYHKPCVLTIHEFHGFKWFWVDTPVRAAAFFLFEWYVCTRKFDVYHAVSDATKKDFIKFCGRRNVRRVYNADEMNPDAPLDKTFDIYEHFHVSRDKKIFLYYGRPGQTKGVNIYEEALIRLRETGTDLSGVRFCFALGAEPAGPRKRFLESIRKHGLKGIVKIRGSLSREVLSACILQADYVVVPSITEGFGFSAIEACQMGKPLIVSDAGSLPEVVFGDVLFFENRNARDLSEKLLQVIKKGSAAFTHIPEKKFTYEDMVGGMEKIYRELCHTV